jgi:hypothetical protein
MKRISISLDIVYLSILKIYTSTFKGKRNKPSKRQIVSWVHKQRKYLGFIGAILCIIPGFSFLAGIGTYREKREGPFNFSLVA